MAADYPTTVDRVHRVLCDEEYWLARLADSGADEASLDVLTVDGGGGVDVVTTQVLRSDRLPGLVTQFHRGDLAITREETWTALLDGHAEAGVAGSIAGAPVAVTGTAQLQPSDAPSRPPARLAYRATVEVRVPLVGRKLENFIGTQLAALLAAEQRFTTRWIAENC